MSRIVKGGARRSLIKVLTIVFVTHMLDNHFNSVKSFRIIKY